jgi:hypothetical protein
MLNKDSLCGISPLVNPSNSFQPLARRMSGGFFLSAACQSYFWLVFVAGWLIGYQLK